MMLDPTEQRVLGVLLEKELAVPESYPLTANTLLAGCNQKSNRDPFMEVEDAQLAAALMSMADNGFVLRVSQAGSRTIRYKHLAEEKLSLNGREKAVLAELLVRGPQAPGALKPRVARMGMAADPTEILAVLEGLRVRAAGALVEQLEKRPRERDRRWGHCLGETVNVQAPDPEAIRDEPPIHDEPSQVTSPSLEERVARLEREVAELRSQREQSAD